MTQLHLLTVPAYPEVPAARPMDTSRVAAKTIDVRSQYLKARVLFELRWKPLTADECAIAIGETPGAVRPMFSELKKLGRIAATDLRRRNTSGKRAIVWKAI
jgi:hypothetical protein